MLRISGKNLVAPRGLVVAGEPEDAINIEVAESNDFASQIASAMEFLKANSSEVHDLIAGSASGSGELDFGVAQESVIMKSYDFPAELVKLSGQLNLSLKVSAYAVSDT